MYKELAYYADALRSYLTSTYHISNPTLVDLRDDLLARTGTIAQEPYLESTARYSGKIHFRNLDIPRSVADLLTMLGEQEIIFDPPYPHQADALERSMSPTPRDLVVTSGTGSGKTETFLLPALARLADEAARYPEAFAHRAVRVLLLYPMNALVNDQLGRLRMLFGSSEVSNWFRTAGGRPAKFARYTGRTLYPGRRNEDTAKHYARLQGLKFYLDLEQSAASGNEEAQELIPELEKRGKWPAKSPTAPGAMDGLSTWYGTGRWRDTAGNWVRTVERNEDPELLIRHEAQERLPDLLVTNYSMLEYMLLRPIERSIFSSSRAYFEAYPTERLLLVLDEAHLYRGAQGTEVAMLLRRLRSRLNLQENQLQVICTSASFDDPVAASRFAAGLAGKSVDSFDVLAGEKVSFSPSGAGERELADVLSRINARAVHVGHLKERIEQIHPLLAFVPEALTAPTMTVSSKSHLQIDLELLCLDKNLDLKQQFVSLQPGEDHALESNILAVLDGNCVGGPAAVVTDGDEELLIEGNALTLKQDHDPVCRLLYVVLSALPVTGRLINLTNGAVTGDDSVRDNPSVGPAQAIGRLASRLFPDTEPGTARLSTDTLIELASMAKPKATQAPLLAARVHAFFRGLPGLWACADTNCSAVEPALLSKWNDTGQNPITGALYAQPRRSCECGARVFELFTCRSCGSAYFRGFAIDPAAPDYLWSEDVGEVDEVSGVVGSLFMALEEPPLGAANLVWLDVVTGRVNGVGGRTREVWVPRSSGESAQGTAEFVRCTQCGARGKDIMDHVTKGDEPFQQLVSAQLLEQPPRLATKTPLQGRKTLIFSDGRQAASRLAGKLRQFSLP